ncbi:hypothetical protein VW23_013930 [Devosia insulae DS-56]|uniref:Uncharacterized protein n=1 Tax=Devosia insulae DS-56 TaxID=1116389 RepID=A0A1E5XTM8_9HYPH|nr:hypothetical protein [Devosia insulae]OEO31939.1 hypothetical protein VW23_013930 [Devosia insulae DS-56]
MEYFNEVLDRSTGELLTVSIGDWVPVTEFGQLYGLGQRKIRTVLRQLDVLQVEGAANHQRHRLQRWVVERGWGKRIEPKRKGAKPFDVLGPGIRSWIAERWEDAVDAIEKERTWDGRRAAAALNAYMVSTQRDLTVPQRISWLAYRFPDLTQEDVAAIVDVTRQLVSKYHRIRNARIRALVVLKTADPDDLMAEHQLNHPVPRLADEPEDELPDEN